MSGMFVYVIISIYSSYLYSLYIYVIQCLFKWMLVVIYYIHVQLSPVPASKDIRLNVTIIASEKLKRHNNP